ncbi:serine/threonine-protein kinase, partial [Haliangium sp. UPWRP_2]|uniref:serine/threonine-protein kinase n=1 Tax=Haliangium sp. UPWRP_2 TaxID=1931276 RepID=UPI001304FF03
MLDRIIGSYRLVRKIGQGGMGAVYEARHNTDGSRAAVKVLLRHSMDDPNAARRFFNEAKAISMVSHPSLVKIFEYGNCPTDDGSEGEAYIVMEYLDGETLRARLAKRYLGQTCLRLMRQLASGLSATHKKRIVHRDLKPDNIMLVADPAAAGGERAKILDFGIAKLLPESGAPDVSGESANLTLPESGVPGMVRNVKTRTGMPIGTPAYMSPEQCMGAGHVDGQTDVYSLGVLLFQMLAGALPFNAYATPELLYQHMTMPPPDLRTVAPHVTAETAGMVMRMLEKDRANRPTMAEVAVRLQDELPDYAQSRKSLPPFRMEVSGATHMSKIQGTPARALPVKPSVEAMAVTVD